jgi:uncharacterized protein YcfJ
MNERKPTADDRRDIGTPGDDARAIAARESRPGVREEPRIPTGDHPIGTAAGAVTGAVAAGAAVGATVGPVGAAVGAAIGAVAGGLAGKGIADMIDPAAEDAHWRDQWRQRSYIEGGFTYDQDYAPAYRYGVDAFTRHPGRRWEDVDAELARGWTGARGDSRLDWERARPASQDAWHRLSNTVERAIPGDSDRDGR